MCGPPDPECERGASHGTPQSQMYLEPDQDAQAANELQEVFGRRVVVIREPIGRRFRTRALR